MTPNYTLESARYEVKLLAPSLAHAMLWLKLHPGGFRTMYPTRDVNSIYFDTPTLKAYWDHKLGLSEREKVRVRWYGTEKNIQPVLEVKYKKGDLGWKTLYNLPVINNIYQQKWTELKDKWKKALPPEASILIERSFLPILQNRYTRAYYESYNQKVRVTVDWDQIVYDQRFLCKPTLSYPRKVDYVVIEMKAAVSDDEALKQAAEGFPVRLYSNSKYVTGLDLVKA